VTNPDNVVPIRRATIYPWPTRPSDCAKAMALMEQARSLLVELYENDQIEEGSAPHTTISYLDDAIGMLSPPDDADLGIAWWNALTERQRLEALKAADSDCPAEAWEHWKETAAGFKCEETAHE
jgi:hypothetical protein